MMGSMTALPGIAQLLRLPETDSTQTVARFLADQGTPDRTLVWADRQTAGRGRLARSWASEPGGLYCSLVLRPSFPPSRLADLSLLAGEAVAAGLARLADIEAFIKPPNDVYAVDSRRRARKISGILCEAKGTERRTDWLIVGIGVNVNNRPALPSAVGLKALTRRPWSVPEVLASVLDQLWPRYERLS